MITFTKEQLIASAHARIEFAEMMLAGGLEPLKERTWSIELELARIALASLEAEPVAEVCEGFTLRYIGYGPVPKSGVRVGDRLYTASPAPVSAPDAMDNAGGVCCEVSYADGWNACRAAMLQGAEPVTTAYKLPFEQWLSQQGERIEIDCGCVSVEVFMHWLRMAYGAGNSPVIPDCSCRTCRPVTFTDSRFVVCHECGNKRCPHANDHRNACTGSNEPGQEGSAYPAAPQQEVKHG